MLARIRASAFKPENAIATFVSRSNIFLRVLPSYSLATVFFSTPNTMQLDPLIPTEHNPFLTASNAYST